MASTTIDVRAVIQEREGMYLPLTVLLVLLSKTMTRFVKISVLVWGYGFGITMSSFSRKRRSERMKTELRRRTETGGNQ